MNDMNEREAVAVLLRVPMSGNAELDAMIHAARRLDAAEKIAAAMVSSIDSEDNYDRLRTHAISLGMKVSQWIAADAIKQADALLAACEPKKSLRYMTDADFDAVHGFAAAPDAEGWIEWRGGECPVSKNATVDVKFRSGNTDIGALAGYWIWTHDEEADDIIAYRVVKDGQA